MAACGSSAEWQAVESYDGSQEWPGPRGGSYTFEALTDEAPHEDIKELAKHTYDGHDFISVLFPVWLARPGQSWMCGIRYTPHPTCEDFAAETSVGQPRRPASGIVAFMLLDMLDNGSTGWLEALRVHPDHRKQGLARKISALVNWQAKQRAGCKRIRYTTTTRNKASLKIAAGLGMKEVQRWLFIAEPMGDNTSGFLKALEARSLSPSADQSLLEKSITLCTPAEATEHLAAAAERHPVLLHDWVARNNTQHTVSELQEQKARFFYSIQDGSVSWCSSRAVYSGDMLHLVGLAAPSAASTAAHIALHTRLAQQEQRESLWVFASYAYQQQLTDWGLCGIGGVKNVPQASPVCVMVQADFGPADGE